MSTLNLKAVLGFDGRGFQAGMVHAERAANRFGSNVLGGLKGQLAAAFSAGAVVAATKKMVEFGAKIRDTSDRLGISTTAFQRFQYAAEQTGASGDAFVGFLEKLNDNRGEALSGNESLVKSFAKLGVTLDDLKTKSGEDLVNIIAGAVKSGDAQNLIGELRDIGGKSAGSLVAAFKTGLSELGDAAPIVDSAMIHQLAEAGDKMTHVWAELRQTFAPIIVSILGGFQTLRDGIETEMTRLITFFSALDWKRLIRGDFKNIKESAQMANTAADQVAVDAVERDQRQAAARGANGKASSFNPAEAERKHREAQEEKANAINKKADEQEKKNRDSLLSTEEKIAELRKEQADLMVEQVGEIEKANARLRLAEIDSELLKLDKPEKIPTTKGGGGIQTDSLLRVGNFLGASGPAISTIDQKLLESSIQVARNTKVIAEYLTKPRAATGSLSDNV